VKPVRNATSSTSSANSTRGSLGHDLAQLDERRRLVQRIQRREDQFFFAFDLFKSNVWIVRQPSRNLAIGFVQLYRQTV